MDSSPGPGASAVPMMPENITPKSAKIRPRIHLEVMKKWEVIGILLVLFFSVVLCVGLDIVYIDTNRTTAMDMQNSTCPSSQIYTNLTESEQVWFLSNLSTSCFAGHSMWIGIYNTTWDDGNGPLRKFDFILLPPPKIKRNKNASCSIMQVCVEHSGDVLGIKDYGSHDLKLRCNTSTCDPITVPLELQDIYIGFSLEDSCVTSQHGPSSPWYILLYCNESMFEWAPMKLQAVDSTESSRYVDAAVRCVLMAWSLGAMAAWLKAFYRRGLLDRMLPEQKWVTLLQCAAIFSSEAISSIVKIVTPSPIPDVIYNIESLIGQGITLSVLLLLAKGGRQTKLRNYGATFYVWPAIIFIFFLVAAIFNAVAAFGAANNSTLFVLVISLVLGAVLFLISFLVDVIRTARALATLPYLRTRYRQLSTRIFLIQATIMILYMIGGVLLNVLYRPSANPTFVLRTHTWSFLIVIYTCVLMIIYLPPLRESKHDSSDDVVDLFLACRVFRIARSTYKNPPEGVPVTIVMRKPKAPGSQTPNPSPLPERNGIFKGKALDLSGADFKVLQAIHNPLTDTTAYLCTQDGDLVLAFRGTKSMTNIRTDVAAIPHHVNSEVFKKPPTWEPFEVETNRKANLRQLSRKSSARLQLPMKLHQGFWRAYLSVRPEILQAVLAQPQKAVIVTGHSLGGALATLAALDLSFRGRVPTLVSFGAPRVGNWGFHEYFSKHVPRAMRIVVDGDPIPSIPKFTVLGNNTYKHIGVECLIDIYGNSIIRPLFVENILRKGSSTPSSHKNRTYEEALEMCTKALTEPQEAFEDDDIGMQPVTIQSSATATASDDDLDGRSGGLIA